MGVITVAELAEQLPGGLQSGDDGYASLQTAIDRVTDLIERVCDVRLTSQEYRQIVTCDEDRTLDIEFPVTSVRIITDNIVGMIRMHHATEDNAFCTVTSDQLRLWTQSDTVTLTLADYDTITELVAAIPAEWNATIEFPSVASTTPLQLIPVEAAPVTSTSWRLIEMAYLIGTVPGSLSDGMVERYDGDNWNGKFFAWYTAGYDSTTLPSGLKATAIELCMEAWYALQRDTGLRAKGEPGQFTWEAFDRSTLRDGRLNPYKRLRVWH